jgi:transcriptional regulator with GAF, ATPase, and Fis domain
MLDRIGAAVAVAALPSEDACLAMLSTCATLSAAACSAAGGALLRRDDPTGHLVVEAVGGVGEGLVGRRLSAAGGGLVGRVLRSEQPVLMDDFAREESSVAEVADLFGRQPTAIAAARLRLEEHTLGAIVLLDPAPQRSGLAAGRLLELLASQAAAALAVVEEIRNARAGAVGGAEVERVASLARTLERLEDRRRRAAIALLAAVAAAVSR